MVVNQDKLFNNSYKKDDKAVKKSVKQSDKKPQPDEHQHSMNYILEDIHIEDEINSIQIEMSPTYNLKSSPVENKVFEFNLKGSTAKDETAIP